VTTDAVGQVSAPDTAPRRGLYLQRRRSQPVAFLSTFDGPAAELNCVRRGSSTAAPQALMLMNGDFALQQARHFARRVQAETPRDPADTAVLRQARHAWRIAYQRAPSGDELDRACRFLARQAKQPGAAVGGDAGLAALTNLCQQLLASNEFLYVD
jgi:hypothetical protein